MCTTKTVFHTATQDLRVGVVKDAIVGDYTITIRSYLYYYSVYFYLSFLPVISAWSRLDEVARDRFWAGRPADFRHFLYVSAWRRARGPSRGPGQASSFYKSERGQVVIHRAREKGPC